MSVFEKANRIALLLHPVLLGKGTAAERAAKLKEISRLSTAAAQELCEARKVELVIPGDANEGSRNQRRHWRGEMGLKKQWRTQAFLVASDALNSASGAPFEKRVRVSWVIRRGRKIDPDNACSSAVLKHCLDGCVDAGLLRGDSEQFVECGTVTQETGRLYRDRPEILLILQEVDDA